MATRFYLHADVDLYGMDIIPTITPAFDAEWDKTTGAVRRRTTVLKNVSAISQGSNSEGVVTTPYDVLLRQFISDPLDAQTISGTVKGQVQCRESGSTGVADFCRAISIRVCSGDGATIKETLLSHFPGSLTSEFVTVSNPNTNRYFPPDATAITSADVEDGDRLLIEIGFRSFNSTATGYSGYMNFGDDAASDLPENETETSVYSPWVEFSDDITFQNSRIEVYQVNAEILYTDTGPETSLGAFMYDYRRRRIQ